jgi:hypothetical protein
MTLTSSTVRRLVPLLVLAAFAVSAAQAQAAPRWLQNGTEAKLENGKLLPITMWGTFTREAGSMGLVKCNTHLAASQETRVSGRRRPSRRSKIPGPHGVQLRIGGVRTPGEPNEITPLGQASNPVSKAKETVGRLTTPWEAVVTEPKAGEWKFKIGKKTKTETQVRFRVVCPEGATNIDYTGELNVMGEGGTLFGASPAVLTFKGKKGKLEGSVGGPGTWSGKTKLMSYEAEEVIPVVNQ